MTFVRAPAVAGTFYALKKEELLKQIKSCFDHELGPKKVEREEFFAAIVPHAGYEFSGPVAAWVYAKLKPSNFLILGPNHHGLGPNFSLMPKGVWKTPLGEVKIDEEMAKEFLKNIKFLEADVLAHEAEHSIEVQLPFLQASLKDFKILPICVMNLFPNDEFLEECRFIGKSIARLLKGMNWKVLATSDFSHYLPHDLAKEIDVEIIQPILELDERKFFMKIEERNASLCGFGPIAIAIVASKELGAKEGILLKYATSGDMTKDYSSVVGYASIIFK